MAYKNKQIVFSSYADGLPSVDNFSAATTELPSCEEGNVIVKNHYISVDPAQKGWMSSAINYASATLGEAMRALAVGEIIESKVDGYPVGAFVTGWFGWQEYAHVDREKILSKVNPDLVPIKYHISILGLNGLTAYIALNDVLAPKFGDTVLVSTAAGGVGSITGQLAKQMGCRVVGLTGSAEKVALCLEDYGYDIAINYKDNDWLDQLEQACPQGIDRYFDMAGGWISDALIYLLNQGAVHAQVGTAAVASWDPIPTAPRRERFILVKELTQKGFVIFNHSERFDAASEHLVSMINDGSLTFREHIYHDLAEAPKALVSLYEGTNKGKALIQLV